ncbi:MAG: IPT/TIG domain-containing protein [Terriglobales bacterium]
MWRAKLRNILFLLLLGAMTVQLALAQASYKYSNLKIPHAKLTNAYGVNDFDEFTGDYTDVNGIVHGYLRVGSTVNTIDDPNGNGLATTCYSINDHGAIVGAYSFGDFSNGFLYQNGVFTDIMPTWAIGATDYGINDNGWIVGTYLDGTSQHGFVYDGTNYTTLDVPGAQSTLAIGINNSGLITLQSVDSSGQLSSWLLSNGTYTQLNVPGAFSTAVHFINPRGEIALGWHDSGGGQHGAIFANGVYYLNDDPDGTSTSIYTINDNNEIVGRYLPAGKTVTEGFKGLNTPSLLNFNPPSGPVGTSVTITGSGFTQATWVTFSNKTAAFTVNSDSQITATVPGTAKTGKIKVTTPAGVATSKTNFVVN